MNQLLSRQAVAELLNVHRNTVDALVRRGELPKPIRVGRQFRWLPEQMEDYFEQQKQRGVTQ